MCLAYSFKSNMDNFTECSNFKINDQMKIQSLTYTQKFTMGWAEDSFTLIKGGLGG